MAAAILRRARAGIWPSPEVGLHALLWPIKHRQLTPPALRRSRSHHALAPYSFFLCVHRLDPHPSTGRLSWRFSLSALLKSKVSPCRDYVPQLALELNTPSRGGRFRGTTLVHKW